MIFMNIISIQTEQTTSITDVFLAVICFIFFALFFVRFNKTKNSLLFVWSLIFLLLFTASFFGAVLHGFVLGESIKYLLWIPIKLSIAISISLFASASYCDMRNFSPKGSLVVLFILTAVCFYTIDLFTDSKHFVLILFQLWALVFSGAVYFYLSLSRNSIKTIFMISGIFITMIASLIQYSDSIWINCLWEFDHNGIYHLVQIPGLFLFFFGVKFPLERKFVTHTEKVK